MTIIANMNNIAKKDKIYFGIVFFVILCSALYLFGFRIRNNFTIGRIGSIQIVVPFSGTSVYIDESKKITSTKKDEIIEIKLSPREHSFIVSKDGYLPWAKKITVPSGKVKKLNPLFVSSSASGVIIPTADKEYYKIRNSIITDKSATKELPIISKDGTVKLWLEDNAILIETGSTTKMVIQPDNVIRNVSFYKNRNDVVIFSNQNSIYAIETETDGIQNFIPIYRGEEPSFKVVDENSIYVYDNGTLMQVVI